MMILITGDLLTYGNIQYSQERVSEQNPWARDVMDICYSFALNRPFFEMGQGHALIQFWIAVSLHALATL